MPRRLLWSTGQTQGSDLVNTSTFHVYYFANAFAGDGVGVATAWAMHAQVRNSITQPGATPSLLVAHQSTTMYPNL